MVIADSAWFVVDSILRIPVLHIWLNPPYIATNTVHCGYFLNEVSFNAFSVTFSSVSRMSQLFKSVVFTHGTVPPLKYSSLDLNGVAPEEMVQISLI